MAGYGNNYGTMKNGFGRHSLHQWEGHLLYMAGYPVPPDFRAPGGWRLSAGGVPIPLPPVGAALDAAIDEVLESMSDEQRAKPRFFPDNYPAWNEFFRRRYERELAAYDDDDWYGTTPPRVGDAGQGSSRWAPTRAASRRRHRRTTAATPATTAAATTRRSTAVWACRTPCLV
jgi:hypothetical protein